MAVEVEPRLRSRLGALNQKGSRTFQIQETVGPELVREGTHLESNSPFIGEGAVGRAGHRLRALEAIRGLVEVPAAPRLAPECGSGLEK